MQRSKGRKNGQEDNLENADTTNTFSMGWPSGVAAILLAFWLGTKMLFVAGGIILLTFFVGVVQSAVCMHQTRPRKNAVEGALNLLPHAAILVLVLLLFYVVTKEFLRAPIK